MTLLGIFELNVVKPETKITFIKLPSLTNIPIQRNDDESSIQVHTKTFDNLVQNIWEVNEIRNG